MTYGSCLPKGEKRFYIREICFFIAREFRSMGK